ncbi:hypothetical protein QGN32_06435 [Mycolicibacterium sp. ND9-15]|uniref:tetratricopeptide repeat protein n=1 Tax=Mycolicibacterium sp. ND9-15 TaxID=3042320 RepID=UPI002DDA0A74|nr:hypothetical protein [Mycolicibacterium sp. ND9-15]WSE57512.1 hypothetical protein QGN32_06435 [Mycolicibacterium sp. ND9-15]
MPVETVLANAAFGDDPGRWPLPCAATPRELWLRAVAAGGQGRYASARADLAKVYRSAAPERALAHSTEASFLRQLGWHTQARRWDGRALVLAGPGTEGAADALIGLAADALGVGRFAASESALVRAGGLLSDSTPPRLRVRLGWVSAELAMARGEGVTAIAHAERAVEHAARLGSMRHQVKSSVVLAAARCSAGDLDTARAVADTALDDTDRLGMVPLRWALACLLADIGSANHPTRDMVMLRDRCADTVCRRGGVWSVR